MAESGLPSNDQPAVNAEIARTRVPRTLQIGRWTVVLTPKLRIVLSLVGLGALAATGLSFLSEFDQTRNIVSLWYSRVWLSLLCGVIFLAVLLVAGQLLKRRSLAVFISAIVAMVAFWRIDASAPKPDLSASPATLTGVEALFKKYFGGKGFASSLGSATAPATTPSTAPPPSPSVPSISYGYLQFPERSPDANGGLMVGVHLIIRDFPTSGDALHGSLASLQHVHIVVTKPIAVNPIVDGWWSCTVIDTNMPQWNNDDGTLHKLADVRINEGTSVIEFRLSTGDAMSSGLVKLDLKAGQFEYKEWVQGSVLIRPNENQIFRVIETLTPSSLKIADTDQTISVNKTVIASYGLPSIAMSGDMLTSQCPGGSQYTRVFPKGTRGGEMHHNFGK
jgi:hypothetical protein